MWNCHLNCAVKLPKGNITIKLTYQKRLPSGLECTCTSLPTLVTANLPVPSMQKTVQHSVPDLTATSARDSGHPRHGQPRTVHLWKSFFLASSKCRCFLTQAQELCSLRCCILARRAHIVYELCIKSVPCPRLLWDLHLLGTWSQLFLLFWNTGERSFLFLVQYCGSTPKFINLFYVTTKRKVACLLQKSLSTLHPTWQVDQSQWSILAVKSINGFNRKNLI